MRSKMKIPNNQDALLIEKRQNPEGKGKYRRSWTPRDG